MTSATDTTVTVTFDEDEYKRLRAVTDSPTNPLYDSALHRIELSESVTLTKDGGFRGPGRFTSILGDDAPTWPLGSLLGLELVSIGGGESQWVLDAGPEHANPMGTVHGGILCDLGDAALGSAYTSTVDPDESFTTVDLGASFLRPVWSGRLEAAGRVRHKSQRIGLAECEITTAENRLVSKLSGTCMTLPRKSADRTSPGNTRSKEE